MFRLMSETLVRSTAQVVSRTVGIPAEEVEKRLGDLADLFSQNVHAVYETFERAGIFQTVAKLISPQDVQAGLKRIRGYF